MADDIILYTTDGDIITNIGSSTVEGLVTATTQSTGTATPSVASSSMSIYLGTNFRMFTMHRGDTFTLSLYINSGTMLDPVHYTLNASDSIRVAIMAPNQSMHDSSRTPIIDKELTALDIPTGDVDPLFTISSSESDALVPGTYYLQVIGNFSTSTAENIQTILPKTKFLVLD